MFTKELPWIKEAKSKFGLHEVKNKAELSKWLKSDGKTLGDPSALPWCGDFAETVIRNSLPKEPFPGDLGVNPYWARNWLQFGKAVEPCYGAIAVFARNNAGHVGFLVGEDATDWYVLGGNQSDSVKISRLSKSRLLGTRWPTTYTGSTKPLPKMSAAKIPRSTNEF